MQNGTYDKTMAWRHLILAVVVSCLTCLSGPGKELVAQETADSLTADELKLIREAENRRIQVIEQVVGSVVAVYGPSRQGGGSGVIIDPSGIALTNHHVIEGAGISGFGGLNDGNLYDWDLVGTDPGGDVAIIKLKGKDKFPFSPMGDSGKVRVGQWALAMGNPFLLAHDQVPTVTLGIVSGIERFQEGTGAQLVYGNCIQIDSSINPGNSGGPLFNMDGQVIGINGRGSFRDRGRVNVGLGYAISINQIKNFLPDLLASKIVEHGTLDAAFSNRQGKIVCATIDLDSPAAQAGLELGDELLEFEGRPITYPNQFKNLICTFPEDWPANLKIRKPDGKELTINVRMFGLPYNFQPQDDPRPGPNPPAPDKGDEDGKGDQEREDNNQKKNNPPAPTPQAKSSSALKKFMLNEPGVVIDPDVNSESLNLLFEKWRSTASMQTNPTQAWLTVEDEIHNPTGNGTKAGTQTITVTNDGRFHVRHQIHESPSIEYSFDGKAFWKRTAKSTEKMDIVEAKLNPVLCQGLALSCLVAQPISDRLPFSVFGKPSLDGSDQALGKIAARIIWLDEDEDWFYGWLSMFDEAGQPQVRLLKMSSDRNCENKSRGLTFADYRKLADVELPWVKNVVSGLGESVQWTAITKSVKRTTPQSETMFSPGDSGKALDQ